MSLVPSITGTALRLDGEAGVGGVTFNQNVRSQRTYLVARAVAAPTSAEPHGDQDSVQRDAGALGGDGKAKDRVALPVSVSVSATATPSGGGDSTAVPLVDRVVRESRVMPAGFPQMLNSGGMVHSSKDLQSASWSVTLPDNIVPGSLRASATVYPTPIASISKVGDVGRVRCYWWHGLYFTMLRCMAGTGIPYSPPVWLLRANVRHDIPACHGRTVLQNSLRRRP